MGNTQVNESATKEKESKLLEDLNLKYSNYLKEITLIQKQWRFTHYYKKFLKWAKEELKKAENELKLIEITEIEFQSMINKEILTLEANFENFFQINTNFEYYYKHFQNCKFLSKKLIVCMDTFKDSNSFNSSRFHDKCYYMGTFNIHKEFHGHGVLIRSCGTKYEGFFVKGVLNGPTRFITPTGDYFDGIYQNGKANGYGVYIRSSGIRYQGNWKDDVPNGFGEEYFKDGSSFKGNFIEGNKTGYGKFTWKDDSIYEGYLKDGKFSGKGTFYFSDGRFFTGDWLDNDINGAGVFTYSDGSVYTGHFQHNKRHGKGKFTWTEAKYFEGDWKDGKQHGEGLYYKNGVLTKGIWNNGKLISYKKLNEQ